MPNSRLLYYLNYVCKVIPGIHLKYKRRIKFSNALEKSKTNHTCQEVYRILALPLPPLYPKPKLKCHPLLSFQHQEFDRNKDPFSIVLASKLAAPEVNMARLGGFFVRPPRFFVSGVLVTEIPPPPSVVEGVVVVFDVLGIDLDDCFLLDDVVPVVLVVLAAGVVAVAPAGGTTLVCDCDFEPPPATTEDNDATVTVLLFDVGV